MATYYSTDMERRVEQPKVENPVAKYVSWKGGKHVYWDKEAEDNLDYDPSGSMVITTGVQIGGWNESERAMMMSNEVGSLKDEPLEVFVFKGKGEQRERVVLAKGLYADIKPELESLGGHVVTVVTVVDSNEDIVALQYKKSSLNAWINDSKKIDLGKFKLNLGEPKELKNGAVTYYVPTFEQGAKITKKDEELRASKVEVIKEFHEYIRSKYTASVEEKENEEEANLPF